MTINFKKDKQRSDKQGNSTLGIGAINQKNRESNKSVAGLHDATAFNLTNIYGCF